VSGRKCKSTLGGKGEEGRKTGQPRGPTLVSYGIKNSPGEEKLGLNLAMYSDTKWGKKKRPGEVKVFWRRGKNLFRGRAYFPESEKDEEGRRMATDKLQQGEGEGGGADRG